jgi:two-component system sensor histidine kinase EvgS
METLVDPELPKALIGDSVRLRQILINLVGNAIKFTEEGSVRLELCLAEPADASRVDLEIAVVDTGKGVAESDRDRIFRAFEQAEGQDHSAFGGTGLGLAICRDLIGLMGGRIWVEANQPRGTVFRFFLPGLPVAAAPVAAREAPDAGTWEYRFAPANILLVDDVPLNHKLLRCLLEDQPFRFRQALDGQEALDAIHQGKPDLVLTDLKMPRLGGEDLADKLRADPELAGIPVIAVTASALNADLERLAPKFDAIILKPVSKERLLAELGRFLAHEKSAPAGPAPSPADARLVPAAGELSADLAAELAGLDAEFRGPSQSSPFSVLREFTARLAAIGVERHSETVQAMVAELEGAIGSYDVGRIRQALERFRNLSRNAGGQ